MNDRRIAAADVEIADWLIDSLRNNVPTWAVADDVAIRGYFSQFSPTDLLYAIGAELRIGSECCYLPPPDDVIVLPPVEWFPVKSSWESCLFHEAMHWSEWRCGHDGGEAMMELRAEFGCALLEALLDWPHCPDDTNIRLWKSEWLREWESLIRAVSQAAEAVEFLLSHLDRPKQPNDPRVETGIRAMIEGKVFRA